LIFVTIVAKLGIHFTEDPGWVRLSDFFVLFAPAWRIMSDFNSEFPELSRSIVFSMLLCRSSVYNDIFSAEDVASNVLTAWIAITDIGLGVNASVALPAGTAFRLFFHLPHQPSHLESGLLVLLFPLSTFPGLALAHGVFDRLAGLPLARGSLFLRSRLSTDERPVLGRSAFGIFHQRLS
jgi:hypothetical protein